MIRKKENLINVHYIKYVSAKMSFLKKSLTLVHCIFLVMETMGIVISNNLQIREFLE